MVKASDVRSLFGKVTQAKPIFRHSAIRQNEPIRGVQAQILKFTPSLCQPCNNARTAPFDLAWQTLSDRVRGEKPPLEAGTRLPLKRYFGPAGVRDAMLNVHLYFLKLLGCYAVEYQVPLPLGHFALCIKNHVADPSLRITFVRIGVSSSRYEIQVSPIDALNVGGKTVSAKWFYIVWPIGVLVTYQDVGHPRLTDARGWHPNDRTPSVLLK